MSETAVGFIGLGAMGLPMARNLALADFDVVVWNRSRPALEAARAAGCRVAADPAHVADSARVVITMLPDLPQVTSVLEGPRGLLTGSLDTLVVMGTVSPVAVAELATELAERDVAVVDAPVSGGEQGAVDGTLSIMAGGDPSAFERVRGYLECMGTTVRHLGGVGSGSLTKACNQLVVAGTLTCLAEAVLLGERGGLDPETLLDVLGGGLAASQVLSQKRERLVSGDFTASGPARYLLKDLGFVLAAAAGQRTVLPVTAAVTQLYTAIEAQGLGGLDNSVVIDLLRGLSTPRTSSAQTSPAERQGTSCR